jgi:hypothetical protein
MRVAWFLFLSLWGAAAAGQTMYKCTDAQRRITYSNETCEKQGLKDAGPVADRVTSMPFAPAQKSTPRTEPVKPPAARDETEVGRGAAQAKPVSPLIDKLLK